MGTGILLFCFYMHMFGIFHFPKAIAFSKSLVFCAGSVDHVTLQLLFYHILNSIPFQPDEETQNKHFISFSALKTVPETRDLNKA